jgi:hypothetical protein
MQHVRHIFRGQEKDPAGCRRDASPQIHPRDYRSPIIVFAQGLMESDLVPGNRRFSDIEEKALCQYLDRLDKLGLPVQGEFLRGAAGTTFS